MSVDGKKEVNKLHELAGCPPDGMIVLEEQLITKGRTSHGHTYSREGAAGSGDQDTSIRATLLALIMTVWCFVCASLVIGSSAKAMGNGDDGV